MPDWKGIVGTAFSPADFDGYCHGLQWNAWRPPFVVVHNTAIPSLAQRPDGLTKPHILGRDPHTIRIHREDPLTTHPCPGKHVRKLEIIQEVHDLMIARHAGEHPIRPVP